MRHDRVDAWLRTLAGCAVMVLPVLASGWWTADRAQEDRTREATARLRDVNETRAFDWLRLPDVPPITDARIIRAADLARLYRDDPVAADRAYKGLRVTVPLRNYRVSGNSLVWHLADPTLPPALAFEFTAPPNLPAGVLWVVGRCEGAVRDGKRRDFTGYDFCVRVVDCELTSSK